MIYIAAPYSHPEKIVRKMRYLAVVAYARRLLAENRMPFSPVIHCRPIAENFSFAEDFASWRPYCLHMLEFAKEMHVLNMTGWNDSLGVTAEIHHATMLNIPVRHVPYNL